MAKEERDTLIWQVNNRAGLEVYLWASGREHEFNDSSMDRFNYIRGTRNLKQPEEGLVSTINECTRVATGGTTDSGEGSFNVISYGLMPKIGEVNFPYDELQAVRRRKSGLTGFFGATEYRQEMRKVDCWKEAPIGKVQLQEILPTDEPGEAYFIRLGLKADLTDGFGRGTRDPSITLIGSKALVEQIREHIVSNPGDYLQFIKDVLPYQEFPNINKNILSKAVPVKELRFVDANKVDHSKRNIDPRRNLTDQVYQDAGFSICIDRT